MYRAMIASLIKTTILCVVAVWLQVVELQQNWPAVVYWSLMAILAVLMICSFVQLVIRAYRYATYI